MIRAVVVVLAGAPLVVAALLAGNDAAAIWAALGLLTGAGTQVFLGVARSAVLVLASVAVVAAATAERGDAAAVGLIAAAAAIVGGLANLKSAGVLSIAPATAAIAGVAPLPVTWWQAGGWLLAGGAYGIILVRVAGVHLQPRPAPARNVLIHTVVLTVLCGVAAGLTVAYRLPHGYWIVLTFVSVLRPSRPESARRARDRIAGTLLGALVPLPLVEFLPGRVTGVAAVLSLFVFLSYMFAGEYVAQVVFLTTTTILVASGGLAASAITLDEYRVLWTLAGVAASALVAVLLWQAERLLNRPAGDQAT